MEGNDSRTVWDVTNRLKGRVSVDLSPVNLNGRHAGRVAGKMMKPEGGSLDFTATYKRL